LLAARGEREKGRMPILFVAGDATRRFLRELLGPEFVRRFRQCFPRRIKDLRAVQELFRGRRGLEIGGPSYPLFGDKGLVPVYRVLGNLDNCLFSAETIFAGKVDEGASKYSYHPLKPLGRQLICDATELSAVDDASYECVLASHCLEHIANPFRALHEWHRVMKTDGLLLLVLPHKDRTFDWRRPVTSLSHMIRDYENHVGEDDVTHVPEVLALHDISKDDYFAVRAEVFPQRCWENYLCRVLHHHVFDTATAVALIDRAGYQIVLVEACRPYNIVVIARKQVAAVENAVFLDPGSACRARSPFPSDWRRLH